MNQINNTILFYFLIVTLSYGQSTKQDSSLKMGVYNNLPWNTRIEQKDIYLGEYSNGNMFVQFEFDNTGKLNEYTTFFYSGNTAKWARILNRNMRSCETELDTNLLFISEEFITYHHNGKIRSCGIKSNCQVNKIAFDEEGNEVYKEIILKGDTVSGLFYKGFTDDLVEFNYYDNTEIVFRIFAKPFSSEPIYIVDYKNGKKVRRKRIFKKAENYLNLWGW